MFEREGDGFVADPESQSVMHAVNETATLNYGADLSYDGLELFFTAASPAIGRSPGIYRATRASVSQPFGNVERIAAITGFAEAPSISADGTTLYYHQEAGGEFAIMTVTRAATGPIVETDVASAITSGSAVLNATVNPDGEEVTDCYIEYGTTAAPGSTGPCAPSPGSGAGPVAVTASQTQAATGHGMLTLLFKNVSTRACTLSGYPLLKALGAHGKVIANATKNPRNSHFCAAGSIGTWISWLNRNVPWWPVTALREENTYSAITAASMSRPPARLYSRNFTAAYCRLPTP